MEENNEYQLEEGLSTLDQYARLYRAFVEEKNFEPSKRQFVEAMAEKGITIDYSTCKPTDVRVRAFELFPDLKKALFNETYFTEDYYRKLLIAIKRHKRFIVTTAVANKAVNTDFLNSMQNYAKRNKAVILVLPCADVCSTRKRHEYNLDPVLNKYDDIFIVMKYGNNGDVYYLNNAVALHTIKMNAKMVNPLSGLEDAVKRTSASCIFAHPKQTYMNIATFKDRIPKAIMTTGCITANEYNTKFYSCDRTATKAKWTHIFGGMIVELEGDNIAHKRQFQSADDGSFTDLDTVYHPDGSISPAKNSAFVVGDSHVGATDDDLYECMANHFFTEDFVTSIVLHDICDSGACNHHEDNNYVQRTLRAKEQSLQSDINDVAVYLNDLSAFNKQLFIVNSNHNRHIDRWVEEARCVKNKEYINLPLFCKGMWAKVENPKVNLLQYYVENHSDIKLENPSCITWLNDGQSYEINGVEVGQHGDRGANGARGSLKTIYKYVGNAVIGHSHSSAVYCDTFQVGTTSNLDMGYNVGLSSWTRTCCLIHEDGTKQLIDFIPNGRGGYTYHA